jgi:Tfp pilus assembly protein PilX
MEELKFWLTAVVSLVMLTLLTVLVVRAVRYMGRVERHLSEDRDDEGEEWKRGGP